MEPLDFRLGRYIPRSEQEQDLRVQHMEAYLAQMSQELEYLRIQLQKRLQAQEKRQLSLEDRMAAVEANAASLER